MKLGGEIERQERTEGKNRVKKWLRAFRNWQTWQWLLVSVLLFPLALTFLRLDNLRMEEKRDAVLAADQAASADQLASTLADLQDFTFRHMNTSTGPFYLIAAYSRDAEAVLGSGSPTERNIYKEAADYCDPKFNYKWSWAYVDCFEAELNKHGAAVDLIANLPNPELYRREYLSPFWTPTLSGFTLLVTGLIFLIVFIRFLIWLGLRIALAILTKRQKEA